MLEVNLGIRMVLRCRVTARSICLLPGNVSLIHSGGEYNNNPKPPYLTVIGCEDKRAFETSWTNTLILNRKKVRVRESKQLSGVTEVVFK